MAKTNIRNKIKDVAKDSFINPTDEFCERVEEELERTITPELIEKVRTAIIKEKANAGANSAVAKGK
jgi:hypothetical protein